MKHRSFFAWVSLGMALLWFPNGCATGPAGGGSASVTFVHPEQFTDFKAGGRFGEQEREAMLADLRQFIESEATRLLPAGRTLDVQIFDINQPGIVMPTAGSVRVSRGLSQARVDLEYVLRDGGAEVRRGKEFVTGEADELGGAARYGETLPAVKQAMRRWLQRVAKIK